MHPISSRCLLAAAALAALPLTPSALQAQGGFDVSVSYGNNNSSSLTGLDALVAPVALYPDPLLGIMLPASTSPNDLQAAASMSGDSDDWQPAVQDMTHYPSLLQWMASNINWTEQLGAAFADNPTEVMNAIQDLRQRALADGALQSNGQILVVNTDGAIQILPQSMDVLYVPEYDPNAVFFGRGVEISFGAALPCGDWLTFYPAWHDHAFYTGDFFAYSRDRGGWGAAVRGGAFVHASGFRHSEWRVSSQAQIRSMHVNVSKSQNFARPQAFNQHTDYRANLRRNEATQPSNARSDQARATEQRNAVEQRQEQHNEPRYAQSPAQQTPRNEERYGQANDQRYSQTNRQTYPQNNPERYAQSNGARSSQETQPRNAQMNDRQRNAQSSEQRYAQSNEQRQPSRNEETNKSENRPSTFTGDSMRQPQEQRSNASRPSDQARSERPQAKTEEKHESKPSNSKSEDDKKKDQQQ